MASPPPIGTCGRAVLLLQVEAFSQDLRVEAVLRADRVLLHPIEHAGSRHPDPHPFEYQFLALHVRKSECLLAKPRENVDPEIAPGRHILNGRVFAGQIVGADAVDFRIVEQLAECGREAIDVFRLGGDDSVDVARRAHQSLGGHGHPADEDIRHSMTVEGSKDALDLLEVHRSA